MFDSNEDTSGREQNEVEDRPLHWKLQEYGAICSEIYKLDKEKKRLESEISASLSSVESINTH